MLWQNASARTVADRAARPRRAPRRGRAACGSWSRPRAACRTTRSRARRAAPPAASFIASRSSGRGQASTCARTSGSTSAGSVGDPVGVAPPERGEARVEARPGASTTRRTRTSAGSTPLSRRSSASAGGVRPRRPRPRPARRRRRRGARPGRGRARRCRCARRRSPRPRAAAAPWRAPSSSVALHGPQPRLGGPAVEVGAVVGEVESEPHRRHPPNPDVGAHDRPP